MRTVISHQNKKKVYYCLLSLVGMILESGAYELVPGTAVPETGAMVGVPLPAGSKCA